MTNYIITIDGPAASGKSTIAKKVANILKISYIDTGAMFRAVALYMLNNNIDIKDRNKVVDNLNKINLEMKNNKLLLDGKDIENDIRENKISQASSDIAVIKEVRELLLQFQRKIANNINVIMDGRDIGTVVFPNADYKFYLTASPEERAKRRLLELNQRGNLDLSFEEILKEIKLRDKTDSTRKYSPLVKAEDAIEIDTTNKEIDEIVEFIINKVRED